MIDNGKEESGSNDCHIERKERFMYSEVEKGAEINGGGGAMFR